MQKIQTNIKIVNTGEKNLHIFKIFKSFTHSLESTVFEKPQGSVCVWGGGEEVGVKLTSPTDPPAFAF